MPSFVFAHDTPRSQCAFGCSGDFRTYRGRRPSEFGPRPPHLQRLGDQQPEARVRYRQRTPCHHSFSRGTSKFSPLRRTAPDSQMRVGWEWVYNTTATIRQGAKTDLDAKVLKAKLLLNWTGPYKVLAVGLCSSADTPGGSPPGAKLLHFDPPSDTPGTDAHRRVSVQRC